MQPGLDFLFVFDKLTEKMKRGSAMSINPPAKLSGAGVDVLGQLFVAGPVWDGNLISKAGRDELVECGLAYLWNGWQTLTEDGLAAAVEWKFAEETPQNRAWFRKQRAR